MREFVKYLFDEHYYHWVLAVPAIVVGIWALLKSMGPVSRTTMLTLYIAGCLSVAAIWTFMLGVIGNLRTVVLDVVLLTPQVWLLAVMAAVALVKFRLHVTYVPHLWLFVLVALLGQGCTTVWILALTAPS